MNLKGLGARLISAGSVGVLVVGLAAPVQAAERTLHDRRGDEKALDIVATKFVNGENRARVATRFRKSSMGREGYVISLLRPTHRPVNFYLTVGWSPRRGVTGGVMRQSRDGKHLKIITRRCGVKKGRKHSRIWISVDADRCFRRAAGAMRFGTSSASDDHAPQKRLVTKHPVKRG